MAAIMTTSRDILAHAMEHHRYGRLREAEAGYRETLRLEPRNADALHLLGAIVASQGLTAQGVDLITRALAINPNAKEAHINLANIYAGLLRIRDAERHFREAYRCDMMSADAANGVGGALLHLGLYAEAEGFLREALALAPTAAPVLLNMGMLMDATARFGESIKYYEQVIALHPDHAEAHLHRGLALLLRGQFTEGWTEYAWRVKSSPTFFGQFPFPYWKGESLSGKKILAWTELGPGDEILAATMIPDLAARGAKVLLLCSPRMAPLFERSFPEAHVFPAGNDPEDLSILQGIDYQASVGHLGAVLRRTFEDFPSRPKLLKADAERTAALRKRYQDAAPGHLIVGISWRSKSPRVEDAKTIPLETWRPVLKAPGITFVSLQYGDTKEEVARARRDYGVHLLVDGEIDPLVNLDDFAAQVAAMDLVISSSNTTVHVAGALGRPVWALVPSNHGRLWYWFLERSTSPWYPSARLFRQDLDAGWQPVLAAAANEIVQFRCGAREGGGPHVPST